MVTRIGLPAAHTLYFTHNFDTPYHFLWLLSTHTYSFTLWCAAVAKTLTLSHSHTFTYTWADLHSIIFSFFLSFSSAMWPRCLPLPGGPLGCSGQFGGCGRWVLGSALCLNPGGDFADPDHCCIPVHWLSLTNALPVSTIEI